MATRSLAVVYAWLHYGDRPAMVPTHFGPSGRPDAWSPRSFWSVMLLPLALLVYAVGGSLFIAIRYGQGGRPPRAVPGRHCRDCRLRTDDAANPNASHPITRLGADRRVRAKELSCHAVSPSSPSHSWPAS